MKIFYGATANECDEWPGWLPIVAVGENVYGQTYCNYKSGVYPEREDAIESARRNAREEHANNWDELERSKGCVRCLAGLEHAKHLVREDDHSITCGQCKRTLS